MKMGQDIKYSTNYQSSQQYIYSQTCFSDQLY